MSMLVKYLEDNIHTCSHNIACYNQVVLTPTVLVNGFRCSKLCAVPQSIALSSDELSRVQNGVVMLSCFLSLAAAQYIAMVPSYYQPMINPCTSIVLKHDCNLAKGSANKCVSFVLSNPHRPTCRVEHVWHDSDVPLHR